LKVLVTGGGGFLGSPICRQLAALGHEVIAYQRRPAAHLEAAGIRSEQGDITDPDRLADAAAGCDSVIHTAGKAGVWGDAREYHRVNVLGTDNVITVCRELSIPRLVYTSSPSIVHAGGDVEGGDETLPIAKNFSAPYPATKAEAERKVIAANGDGLSTTALRPHLVWGPGDPHFLPRLVEKASGGTIALPGPDKKVDTIFVENAALAHVMALDELKGQARCAGKSYFVTNREPLPQGEIIRKLLLAVGIDVRVRAVPVGLAKTAAALCESAWKTFGLKAEPPLTRFSVDQLTTAHWFDTSAAECDFGYVPKYSIEQGLKRLHDAGG
jgi:nucleoside-diphosphate-sugar epimerase